VSVSASTLLREALGYAKETSLAPVRTHVGNLRASAARPDWARLCAPTRAAATRRPGSLLPNLGIEPSRQNGDRNASQAASSASTNVISSSH
jgi:hypothetical protein